MSLCQVNGLLDDGARPADAIMRALTTIGVINQQNLIDHIAMCGALGAEHNSSGLQAVAGEKVLAQFLDLVRGQGSAALVATHNERLAAKMDRVVRLHEGMLE